MAELIAVKPAHPGLRLRHPFAGELPDEGGFWPADQFTFRRFADGDITNAPIPIISRTAKSVPENAPVTKDSN